eukprot:6180706-Pleurochrysis_carterae.AAC.3
MSVSASRAPQCARPIAWAASKAARACAGLGRSAHARQSARTTATCASTEQASPLSPCSRSIADACTACVAPRAEEHEITFKATI